MNTEILKISSPSEPQILRASGVIRGGGLCVIPTETVYGIAANALDGNAVDGIFRAKKRPAGNPLTVHISDFEDIEKYAENVSKTVKRLAELFWSGPLTMILQKSDIIPEKVTAGSPLVGLRMPDNDIAREIIHRSGVPVVATSANLSGSPSPTRLSHVVADLQDRVDCIVDAGDCPLGIESTVINMTCSVPKILRLGCIGREQLEEAIGSRVEIDEKASPSGELKHYSVGKRAVLINSNLADFCKYVEKHRGNVCVLCFDGEESAFCVPCVAYGKETEPHELARGLFSALRKIERTDAEMVFMRCPNGEDAFSTAVRNHLLKTASGEYLKI